MWLSLRPHLESAIADLVSSGTEVAPGRQVLLLHLLTLTLLLLLLPHHHPCGFTLALLVCVLQLRAALVQVLWEMAKGDYQDSC
ncbi:hypothetical protein Acr_08g0010070 [Actinidia rufa]|uniref:Uncharacterized protein n=1 Tax=Actinidia rufa TaxID=165716 RepID=A0A7J0F1P1_9ERIC|nr:hypothetical protein Acr_08g0010070 [Actinidia rufa]